MASKTCYPQFPFYETPGRILPTIHEKDLNTIASRKPNILPLSIQKVNSSATLSDRPTSYHPSTESPSLKLHHPLGAFLVEHPMPTGRASNHIALAQPYLVRALATDVLGHGALGVVARRVPRGVDRVRRHVGLRLRLGLRGGDGTTCGGGGGVALSRSGKDVGFVLGRGHCVFPFLSSC